MKNIIKFGLVTLILALFTVLMLANGVSTTIPQQAKVPRQTTVVIFPDGQDRYLVELLVQGYGDKERKESFVAGLREIIAKNDKVAKALGSPMVQEALARPELYVEQFSYTVKDDGHGKNGHGKKSTFLRIKFVGVAVAKLLQRAAKTENTPVNSVIEEAAKEITTGKPDKANSWIILKVFGIASLEQQSQLIKYLKTLDQYVVAVEVVNVNATDVDVAVEMVGNGDWETFVSLLSSQRRLVPNLDATAGLPVGDLHYKWVTGNHEQATAVNP